MSDVVLIIRIILTMLAGMLIGIALAGLLAGNTERVIAAGVPAIALLLMSIFFTLLRIELQRDASL